MQELSLSWNDYEYVVHEDLQFRWAEEELEGIKLAHLHTPQLRR